MQAAKWWCVFCLMALAGCGLKLPIATIASERDTTGKFDGKWVLEANGIIGNCKNNFKRAYMEVKNGEGQIGPVGPTGKGYISSAGSFRIEVPRDYSTIRRVYGGNLVSSKGRVILAQPTTNKSSDCTIGFSIRRIG